MIYRAVLKCWPVLVDMTALATIGHGKRTGNKRKALRIHLGDHKRLRRHGDELELGMADRVRRRSTVTRIQGQKARERTLETPAGDSPSCGARRCSHGGGGAVERRITLGGGSPMALLGLGVVRLARDFYEEAARARLLLTRVVRLAVHAHRGGVGANVDSRPESWPART